MQNKQQQQQREHYEESFRMTRIAHWRHLIRYENRPGTALKYRSLGPLESYSKHLKHLVFN